MMAGEPMHIGLKSPELPAQAAQGNSQPEHVHYKKMKGSMHAPKMDNDPDPKYTTVMLRNIPNKYTRQMLIDQLHRVGYVGDIDYMYLPIDFANKCNVGYCFINFRTSSARSRFVQSFDGVAVQTCLPGFNSYKVCQVTRAKWQGREENVKRLCNSPDLMSQLAIHTEWLPLLLDEVGNQEPFNVNDRMAIIPTDFRPAPKQGPRGGRGRGRKGGGRGEGHARQMGGKFADPFAFMQTAGMMSMPVMTDQGMQYMPVPVGPAFYNSPYAMALGQRMPYTMAGDTGGGNWAGEGWMNPYGSGFQHNDFPEQLSMYQDLGDEGDEDDDEDTLTKYM